MQYKLLRVFLIVTFINEFSSYFMKLYDINTLINYNLYCYFRFVLLSFIYSRFFSKYSIVGYTIRSFYVLTIVLFFLNIFLYNGFSKVHTIYLNTGSLFVIILCLCRFYTILASDNPDSPYSYPFFWISTGFFFFFLMIIPSLGLINLLISQKMDMAMQSLIITRSMSILLYLFISIDYFIQCRRLKLK